MHWRQQSNFGHGLEFGYTRRRRIEKLGDTEVEQLGRAIAGDEDVVRFEVAVNDEIPVRILHRVANPAHELEPLADGQPPGITIGIDWLAFDVLHDEVRHTVVGGTTVQQLRDTGVRQVREDLSLDLEAAAPLI